MNGAEFEEEVRRIARELWPSAAYDGAAMLEKRERDGIFDTEYVIHLLECTMLRTKEKAKQDIEKIRDGMKAIKSDGKGKQGWFITLDAPTADQRALVHKGEQINVLSFAQFQAKLIDALTYLRARDEYPFGSARNPEDGQVHAPERYVPLSIAVDGVAPEISPVSAIAEKLEEGSRVLLLGDYGVGKSMTVREIYRHLATKVRQGKTTRLPVHINLRDHQGQSNPAELLHRHCVNLGFSQPHQVVRAWRAGYVYLLLDGFDEIATMGWSAQTKDFRRNRHKSVEVIRRFVRESPSATGILIAGRGHFFDSRHEMLESLVGNSSAVVAQINEFNDQQIAEFLAELSWTQPIPSWVPGKPLLLAYLAARGLLREVLDVTEGTPPAIAWDNMLDAICHREAQIETGLVASNVRRIIERLATFARRANDGIGPVFFTDVEQAFIEVVGYPPDEAALVLLQRLPGLGAPDPQDQSRRFVDEQLVDTARAGDLVDLVRTPFADNHPNDRTWKQLLGQHGVEVAAMRIANDQQLRSNLPVSVQRLSRTFGEHSPMLADLVRIAGQLGQTLANEKQVYISEIDLPSFIWSGEADLRGVGFYDCIVGYLDLPREGDQDQMLPKFERCMIQKVDGRVSAIDLPSERFVDCEVDSYLEGSSTTSAILQLGLARGTRVTLTVLKKLYRQAGSGREEGALRKGLPLQDRTLVQATLDLLKQEGLAAEVNLNGRKIWLPIRGQQLRVSGMLDSPTTSKDPVIQQSSAWR